MKAFIVTSNQDGSTGEFSRQGARMTSVNTTAITARDHACTFGHVMAGGMTDTRSQCSIGCGLDGIQQEAYQVCCLKEGTTR